MTGPSDVSDEAAAWVVRLSASDVGEAEWLAFLAWLDDGPPGAADLRRTAFDRAQSVWLALDGVELPIATPAAPPVAVRKIAWAPLAVAAALVLSLGVWPLLRPRLAPPPAPGPLAAVAYVTAVGESRTIRLADGSRIDMDGATALSVSFGADGRRVVLTRGETIFDVVHDPSRSFIIDLGGAQVRVLGTAFDIERENGSLQVAVARGVVSLRTGRQVLRLPAGTLAQLEPNRSVLVRRMPTAEIGDWREGRRLYMDAPLARIVADLNRRYPRPIRIDGDKTAKVRFTGVLVLGPQDRTVRHLTALLPLDARTGDHGEIVLSSRRP